MSQNARSHKIFPLIVLLGCGAAYILLFFLPVSEQAKHSVSTWLLLAFLTVLVFGLLVQWFWQQRRTLRFWVFFCALLIAHVLALSLVRRTLSPIPSLWVAVGFAIEAAALWSLMSLLLGLPLNRLDE
jgi:hypothetical protein